MSKQARRALREGLVGDHRDLYVSNAWFRQGVDQLARFLPFLVDGLAAQAEDKEAEAQENFQTLIGVPLATDSDSESDPGGSGENA